MHIIKLFQIVAIITICKPSLYPTVEPPSKEIFEEFLDLMNTSLNRLLEGDELQNILSLGDNTEVSHGDLFQKDLKTSFAGKPEKMLSQSGLILSEPSKRDASELPRKKQKHANMGSRQISPTNAWNRPVNLNVNDELKDLNFGFEGYQDLKFHPSMACDRFDAPRHHCTLVRQLGATLTLGVRAAGTLRPGASVRWYRYLKKQPSEHFIRENLKRDFLPWNLNLGGSQHELRISPITETDRAYNYFVAELDARAAYRPNQFAKRPVIRFTIEPVHLDMGPLYHGEEIVLYARSHMEVPPASVQFHWSLLDSNDAVDRGLPSNMRLNSDRSTLVIKELKTYQNQILTCTAYSNKNVMLARRDFLFRGFVSEKVTSTQPPPNVREKRDLLAKDQEQPDSSKESSHQFYQYSGPPYSDQREDDSERWSDSQAQPSDGQAVYRTGDSSKRDTEHSTEDSTQVQNIHMGPLRFDDVESQIMASCATNHDCNAHAVCTRASNSGQKFCKCLSGYRGNGLFCMIELQ